MKKITVYLMIFVVFIAICSFKKNPVKQTTSKIKIDSVVQENKKIPLITYSEIAQLSRNEFINLIKSESLLKKFFMKETRYEFEDIDFSSIRNEFLFYYPVISSGCYSNYTEITYIG